MIFHWRFWLPGGLFSEAYLAVSFFFILSGFVIDHAFTERLKGTFSFRKFVVSRVIRLYPMIVFGALFGATVYYADPSSINTIKESRLIVPNTLLAMLCLPSPAGWLDHPFSINRPMWSLFFEIIANLAFALVLFRLSVRKLLWGMTLLAIPAYIILAFKFGRLQVGTEYNDLAWGVLTVFPPFVIGMLLNRIRNSELVPAIPFWLAATVLIASLAPPSLEAWNVAYEFLMIFGLYPLLILGAQRMNPTGNWKRVAKFGANISYPIYIIHMPLTEWLAPSLSHVHAPFVGRLILLIFVAVGFSAVIGRYFEGPTRKFLQARILPATRLPSQSHSAG